MDEAQRLEAASEAEKEFFNLDDKTRDAIVAWGQRHYPKCGYRKLGLIVSQRESFCEEV